LASKHALAHFCQIGNDGFLILVQNFCAHRHAQRDRLAIFARAPAPHAALAGIGEEMLLIAEINQRVQPIHHFGPDIAAFATIAAIRAAIFDELLAPE
jgi:RsiW-degrading membrane proteinase PrsW (M82 family)